MTQTPDLVPHCLLEDVQLSGGICATHNIQIGMPAVARAHGGQQVASQDANAPPTSIRGIHFHAAGLLHRAHKEGMGFPGIPDPMQGGEPTPSLVVVVEDFRVGTCILAALGPAGLFIEANGVVHGH